MAEEVHSNLSYVKLICYRVHYLSNHVALGKGLKFWIRPGPSTPVSLDSSTVPLTCNTALHAHLARVTRPVFKNCFNAVSTCM